MTSARKLDKRVLIPGLALLAIVVIGADALSAQGRATAIRSPSGGSSVSGGSPSSGSSSSVRSSSGSSAPRATASPPSGATARSSSRRAADTRTSTPRSRGRRGGGHVYPRHYFDYGLHFGYGYGWGGLWGGYYYPYYHAPYYWGVPYYVPRRAYGHYKLGAFDLNVRPKKTEVYLDGQYIGTAGQYDGFPDHLWLEEGSYELIFYRPGLATERRVLTIYPGVVVDVRLRLEPGESVAPAELSRAEPAPEGAMAEVREAYRKQQVQARPAPPPVESELDTRAEPGRVRLSVLPADASVYLDGRLLGSGDELRQLRAGLVVEAGNHFIEVVRPGYTTVRREFTVEQGAEIELEVLLEAG